MINNQRRQFPELLGQHWQHAAAYVAAQGYTPVILRPNDPRTKDLRMNRVRLIVDPVRALVIEIPVVG